MRKSLHELSRRQQVAGFAVLSALMTTAAWQTMIAPARADLAARNTVLWTTRADIAKASVVARQLPMYTQQIAALEQTLGQMATALPDDLDAETILRDLHTLASATSVEISSFTPKPVNTKPLYVEWPIDVSVNGNYHDLGRFFDRVARSTTSISVSDLHIHAATQPGGRDGLVATCVATAYVFRKDAPAAKTSGGK